MPTVFIPASLRKLTDGVKSVEVDATNIREVVEQLEQLYPGIQDRLCDGSQLRKGLAVAIDSRVHSHGLLEPVVPESEVHFVPTVSGG